MGVEIEIPGAFGWVALVAVVAALQHLWMWYEVMRARIRYKVNPPKMYLGEEEENAKAFNCVQRAHQNSAENLPLFFPLLILGGMQHPRLNALAGLAYVAGRFLYYFGYTSGDAKERMRGLFWVGAIFFMCATTLSFGIQSLLLVD